MRRGAARVGLVDLGLHPRHPALEAARVLHRRFGGRGDPHRHGTRSVAILLGRADAVASADEVHLTVASVGRGASDRTLAGALDWLGEAGTPVVAAPIGQRRLGPRARRAVRALVDAGVTVVASAGNAGPDVHLEPARLPGVLSVTGADPAGRVLSWCCSAPRVDLAGPGYRIRTGIGDPDDTSGSSPACALVARWLALGDALADLRRRLPVRTGTD